MTLLTLTNILIGLGVILCCVLVLRRLVSELRQQNGEREAERKTGKQLSEILMKLGITMQDGGKALTEEKK